MNRAGSGGRSGRWVLRALVLASLAFAAFPSYRMMLGRRYEASALLSVEAAQSLGPAQLTVLGLVLRDLLPGSYEATKIRVEPEGAGLRVRVEGASPSELVASCNRVAENLVQASRTATPVFETAPASSAEAALVALAAQQPAIPAPPPRPHADVDRARLEIERRRVQADLALAAAQPAADADNPFDASRPRLDARRLKLRLAEIDGLLANARATASEAAPAPSASSTELARLVDTVARETPRGGAPSLRIARTAEAAMIPSTMSDPLVLGLGVLVAFGVGLVLLRPPRTVAVTIPAQSDGATPTLASAPPPGPPPSTRPDRRSSSPPRPSSSAPPPRVSSSAPPPRSSSRPPRVSVPLQLPSPPPVPASIRGADVGLAVGNRSAAQVHAYAVAWRSALLAEPVAHPELVAEVRRLAGADCFVLVVAASVDAANQKAKVALGLALSLAAEDDARVLLMDADTREPCLHRMLELEMPEKTDFAAQLGARIRGSGDSIWHVVKCTSGLHVLPCATPAPDLIASEHFEHCVQDLRNFYDVVVVHGPVVNDTIACRAVNEISDGVVVTCAVGEVEPHRNLGAFTRRRLSSVVLV